MENSIPPATGGTNTTDARGHSVIPSRMANYVEDFFHIVLAILLIVIAVAALVYTVVRVLTTDPFFPTGMIQAINDVLFIVIILEIVRTIIARFTDGVFQLQNFLVIGVIAAVRHILTVGASLTLEPDKPQQAFERGLLELGVNTGIVVGLVLAIYLSRVVRAGEGGGASHTPKASRAPRATRAPRASRAEETT
jgi:uncharacterized membrane protein (DUF373 family)